MSGNNPEGRTVEVLELPGNIDEELLYLYFENKRRSGGGPLESVEIKQNCAVLRFEDAEAAARVLSKGHHVVHNSELSVRKPPSKDRCRLLLRGVSPYTSTEMIELYVENMMDLKVTDYTLIPSPEKGFVLIHLSQPLSKDFQTLRTRISKRKLDGSEVTLEQIEQTDSVLLENMHPGTSPDLLRLYFESERGGNQRVKEVTMLSEGTAKVTFAYYESVDCVLRLQHKVNDTELVVKAYFDFLQPATQDSVTESQDVTDTDSVEVENVDMQTSPLPVDAEPSPPAGTPHRSQEPPAANVVEVEEAVMEDQTVEIEAHSCHIPVTDRIKLAWYQKNNIQQDVQKAHPSFSIQIKDDTVHVSGPNKLELEQIKDLISRFFGSIAETRFTVGPEVALFLEREDVKNHLLQTLTQRRLPALFVVSDSTVSVTSLSKKVADQAGIFLKSQVCEFSVPLESEQEALLCCREWSDFLQTLGYMSTKSSERPGSVDILTLKGMENDKQAAIMQFLTTPIEREALLTMEPGMLKYIQIHCHQLLADMDQVSIFPLEGEENCGLKIHGQAVACQMAEEVLQGVVSSVCTRIITVNVPGVSRFLDEKECRSILNEMETKFQVYISLKYVPWEPLPHQDIFESAWKMLSQKNIQKGCVNGSAPELKADSMQTDSNGATNTGLLAEAKRIVSTVDKRQEDGVPAPDQFDDMDNLDLYTAEEPSALADQDVTDVQSPQPLSDQNVPSAFLSQGVLGSSLEEEAQLSLAIQYSMEANQWSQQDEEEQFQKALELSKKMTREEHSNSPSGNSQQVARQQSVDLSFENALKAANTLQLHVFAGYSCDLIRVDIAFNKKVNQRQVEEKVEHRTVKNMTNYHAKCLEVIKRKHAVDVQVQGTIIAVSGFKDYVTAAISDVKLLLENISNAVSDKEILKTVQWVHHNPITSKAKAYSTDAIVFIENAWRMKLKKVDILFDNQPHIINFEKMQEYNIASGKSVKISRKLLELGDVTQDVPEEEYSLLSHLPDATKIDEESEEFQEVVKNFYSTIQEYHSKIRIIQVEKLMNRLLYNQYKLKKASVLQHSTQPIVERVLYHGTSEGSVKEICVHGFNRSFCGKNATVYGQGVYFAVNSALSVQDQYSPPNADGYKFIFASKVLTGDFTKGCHSMKTAPLKETGNIPLRYDSVTDDITKPTMFVIFNDTQAFPEYLITCQRIYR
ncbi:poly [ADP-ribose] polymerase 10 [Poecilia latipinna]|uniref:poly [ADP-ribose] polymerase 10 n=1 Tax=Poecilia latipinna TaxID=48699 RepID=UPI00072E0EAB|nr:PREDICTED: poly [ADP-ribose] polymerase 10 [Poecilia latipinna]